MAVAGGKGMYPQEPCVLCTQRKDTERGPERQRRVAMILGGDQEGLGAGEMDGQSRREALAGSGDKCTRPGRVS